MENNQFEKFDYLISKYIAIWIWSIILGINATFTYRLIVNVVPGRDWGSLGLPMILLNIIALVVMLNSWRSLYLFLSEYIIPRIFPNDEGKVNLLELNAKSLFLKKSFNYIISAAVIMFIIELYAFILYTSKSIEWLNF